MLCAHRIVGRKGRCFQFTSSRSTDSSREPLLSINSRMLAVEERLHRLHDSPHLPQYVRDNSIVYRRRFLNSIRAALDHLRREADVVADIGAGAGVSLALAQAAGFSHFIAADFYWGNKGDLYETLSPVQFVTANFNTDSFLSEIPDESVDCVLSSQVFEHVLHHPVGYLDECWRIVAPGGVLVIDIPNPATLINAIRVLRGQSFAWGDIPFASVPKLNDPEFAPWDIHFREYFPGSFRKLLSDLPSSELVETGFVAT
jgi:SAM-dependent methyltransferase